MKTWSRIVGLIFLIACVPPEPPNIGEFPIGLSSLGDTAGLVTYFIPEPNGSKIGEFRLFEVRPDGTVYPLSITHASFNIGYSSDAAVAITRSADKIEAFILAGHYAISINREQSFSRQLDDIPLFNHDLTPSLGVLTREKNRNWVWLTGGEVFTKARSAVTGGTAFYVNKPASLPLIEFEGSEINVIATNVMWAHCGADWCQQLRFESGTVRLYASPVTSDLYLRPVTATTQEFEAAYHTCNLGSLNRSVIQLGDDYFALSQTEPAMQHLVGYNELLTAIPEAQSCSAFEGKAFHLNKTFLDGWNRTDGGGYRVSGLYRRFGIEFSDGRILTASPNYAGSLKETDCGWAALEPFDGCNTIANIYETKLEFHDESEAVTTAFPIHDLK